MFGEGYNRGSKHREPGNMMRSGCQPTKPKRYTSIDRCHCEVLYLPGPLRRDMLTSQR